MLMKTFKSKKRSNAVCLLCNETYVVETYRLGRTKYCGSTCRQKAAAIASGKVISEKYRGTGTKHKYIKMNGRHMHRVIAEQKIGRPLRKGEVVHHIDGNSKNNEMDNLQVMKQSEHIKIHLADMNKRRKELRGY